MSEVWIIDSSSIIAVRERVSRVHEISVFRAMTALVETKTLLWPPEVSKEILEGSLSDTAKLWIKNHRGVAERPASFATVKGVLAIAPTLVDADGTHEQADPYVVALGVDMATDGLFSPAVTIVTEDRRDKPGKTSLATAAGLLRLPTVPLIAFLSAKGIETGQ